MAQRKRRTNRDRIKTLAVAYHAYMVDIEAGDHNGIIVWGRIVIEEQDRLKVTVIDTDTIQRDMKRAYKALGKEPIQ